MTNMEILKICIFAEPGRVTTRELNVLIAVLRHGNQSRAAEILGVSRQRVSQIMRRLKVIAHAMASIDQVTP